MIQTLTRHPETPCDAISAIEVEVSPRAAGSALDLRYVVRGAIAAVLWPPAMFDPPNQRTDELWQHTCFEAFVRQLPGQAYYEFNFSPSTEWAAYKFVSYREAMAPADEYAPWAFSIVRKSKSFSLDTSIYLPATEFRLGLSAVIEEANGRKSYWALAHPPGKPDFHHADGFALELPGAPRP